jgi:hypothetical protein
VTNPFSVGVYFAYSLKKEVLYYEQEVVENESTLQVMKEQNRNPHDIKKFEEVLGESQMMIPDSRNRLEQALSDLATYLDSAEVKGLEADQWYLQAQELLKQEGTATLEVDNNDVVQETDVSNLQEGETF